MNPVKILFDENFGKPIVDALARLLFFHPDKPIIGHVLDRFKMGTEDPDWIPVFASEGWVFISSDRAKRCGGAKLPDLCVEHKATHILLTTNIHQLRQFDKATIILNLWSDIAAASQAHPGSRFHLQLIRGKPGILPITEEEMQLRRKIRKPPAKEV